MKTILISGANGYIGLHMSALLKKMNFKVITATRDTGGDIKMDYTEPAEIVNMELNNVDAMIHFVSPNENLYSEAPHKALAENAAGVHAALVFCEKNKIPSFIYVSSFHVFGNSEGELNEETPISPRNNYGLAHCTAEETVKLFDRTNRVKTWIVRPSNVFGIPQDLNKFKRWNLIPFSFCKQAVEEKQIILLTSGRQYRNFVGVSDLCQKILWIVEKEPINRIIHAYGTSTLSVLKYAELVKHIAEEKFGVSVDIIKSERNDEVVNFDFTSLYKSPELSPKDRLEEFVTLMLDRLLDSKKEEETYEL
ncbi:dTDP-glucose 4,6-dehydratase [Paenibacillus sp. JJ-100]|uniref:NAD-dependent epimerase/dehydratase family protein n=1 Tax=Paenibacillus sp. JJ-100 TaxID=2974896 RepID=UPI0022FF70DA|nr:NAD(P)-dependent oxidoreductase [Paenibacillus sp. JJ-100]CAI6081303.1 dTDP-glucose 4,6-dehydratase [Paenibacillus sp. JJ-100]